MKTKNKIILVSALSAFCGLALISGLNVEQKEIKAADGDLTLTINYLKKSDSTPVSQSYVKNFTRGSKYKVDSPTSDGLIALQDFVKGRIFQNETINVYYEPFDAWDGTESEGLSGDGSKSNPYQINSAEDLAYLSSHTTTKTAWDKNYFSLNTSVSLKGYKWEPIARGNHGKGTGSFVSWFCGNFNGNNHVIADMKCEDTSSTIYGLFSGIKNSTVENLYLTGSIKTKSRGGSIAYVADGTCTIKNVSSTINHTYTVEGLSGGILGLHNSNATVTIENCKNYGNISMSTEKSFIGGICGGYTNAGTPTIKNCINYGDITTGGFQAGGIYGGTNKAVTITGCDNYGDLTSTYTSTSTNVSLGGVVGMLYATKSFVTDCNNYGDVTSKNKHVGGILGAGGDKINHQLTNVTNYGNITGTNLVAGICGNGSGVHLENGVNYGNVKGSAGSIGGIFGQTNDLAAIDGASNFGNVETTGTSAYCGLITGYHGIGSIINIKETDSVKGTLTVNGVQSFAAFGYTNCVEIIKWYNGEIYSYEAIQPGSTYLPININPEIQEGRKVSDWYVDDVLKTKYVPTSYGEEGVNTSNKIHLNIYSKSIKLYGTLLNEIDEASTCVEYDKAAGFRDDISYLNDAEQVDILEEIVDESYTVDEKLSYMEYLAAINAFNNSSNGSLINAFANDSIIIFVVLILAAVVFVSLTLLLKSKKKNKPNE